MILLWIFKKSKNKIKAVNRININFPVSLLLQMFMRRVHPSPKTQSSK
jgi:hypothetical protein